MDREMLEERLALAECHVTSGERIVACQRALVTELARDGHDTCEARGLLKLFEKTLAIYIADRNRLRAELEELK